LQAYAKRLQKCLEQRTDIDHNQFACLVNAALAEGILTQQELAHEISVSLRTVRRWAQPVAHGKPHRFMRPIVIKAMRDLVLSKIQELRC
jgi:hypothetical protein